MSADNGYIIRKFPDGWKVAQYFASNDYEEDEYDFTYAGPFDSLREACEWCDEAWSEYGYSIDWEGGE